MAAPPDDYGTVKGLFIAGRSERRHWSRCL
jgi:hypothetical protein